MKTQNYAFMALIVFVGVFGSQSAYSWGDRGHQIVGEIAEELINPQTKDFVRGILGVEPMAIAANWPDHVRDDQRFGHVDRGPAHDADNHNFADYHFCEVPVGFTYATLPTHPQKDCMGAIVHAAELLKRASASREEKLIALRYLIHVVGDVHQPLHVGNGFDHGANACQIKWQKTSGGAQEKFNFHSFWDDTMVELVGESYTNEAAHIRAAKYYPDFIKGLRARYDNLFTAAAKAAVKTDVAEWLTESTTIRDGIYPDKPESMAQVKKGEEYKNRPYCLWYVNQETDKDPAPGSVIDQSKIPVLTSDYSNKFIPIVEKQLIKGGLRLAKFLDEIAAAAPNASLVNDARQEQILKSVQDTLKNK